MMIRIAKLTAIVVIVLSGALWSGLLAQTTTGRIVGVIKDASGAVVPGVEIVVRNPGTGLARNVLTNESGAYTVSLLPPAVYEVEASLPGFQRELRSGITLQVDTVVRIDFEMRVGDVTDQIQVTADAPLLQSENASFGQV